MANKFFPEELSIVNPKDNKFFPEQLPEIELEQKKIRRAATRATNPEISNLSFSETPSASTRYQPRNDTEHQPVNPVKAIQRFGSRALGSDSALMKGLTNLQFNILENFLDVEELKESNPDLYKEIRRKDEILAGKDIEKINTGSNRVDETIDIMGSIGGAIFDYATIGSLIGPVVSSTNLPAQSGIKFGATRMAKTGLEDLSGEDKDLKDYARSGIGGFAAGEVGGQIANLTRNIFPTTPDSVYPFVEKGLSGAGVGATFTGVDYLFEPEETTLADLGMNMASMAVLYTLPLVNPENRAEINQARMNLAHLKALDENTRREAFKALGLSKNATEQDIKNKWKDISSKIAKSDLTETEKLHILSDTKQAREEALNVIEKMPVSQKIKNTLTNTLNQITTGISRKFTDVRPGELIPVEQDIINKPLVSVDDFVRDIDRSGIPKEFVGKITTKEIENLLTEPQETTMEVHRTTESNPVATLESDRFYDVFRIDEGDFDLSSPRPQGTYFSLINDKKTFESPHKDIEGKEYRGVANPQNPLHVDSFEVIVSRMGLPEVETSASGGISALKELTSKKEFEQLWDMNYEELTLYIENQYPNLAKKIDFTDKHHDAYFLLENIGAEKARQAGYDAIIQQGDKIDFTNIGEGIVDYSEFIALDPSIVEIEGVGIDSPQIQESEPIAMTGEVQQAETEALDTAEKTPEIINDRDHMTIERVDQEPFVITRGEKVNYLINKEKHPGIVKGVSHARNEIGIVPEDNPNASPLWLERGYIYPYTPEEVTLQEPEKLSDAIDKVNRANAPEDGFDESHRVPQPGELTELEVGEEIKYTPEGKFADTIEGKVVDKLTTSEGTRYTVLSPDGSTYNAYDYKGKIETLTDTQETLPDREIKTPEQQIETTPETISTEKYGKIKIISDDPEQPTVLVENEQGTQFMLGRQALENIIHEEGITESIEQQLPEREVEQPLDMEERRFDNVGNRKVKAYQYEHPELRPFYAEQANILLGDLKAGVKGERIPILEDQRGHGHEKIKGYTGTDRFMSDTIVEIKEKTGASYTEIEDALERIIKDKGQENIALAKRIELILDSNLTEGYKTFEGEEVSPNREYIRVKNQIEGIEQAELSDKDILRQEISQSNISNIEEYLNKTTEIIDNWGLDIAGDDLEEIYNEIDTTTILESKVDDTGNHYTETLIGDKKVKLSVEAPHQILEDSTGDYITDTDLNIELPEIVEIARGINEGKFPHIVKHFRSPGTQGRFISKGKEGTIELRADIFKGPIVESQVLNLETKDEVLDNLAELFPEEEGFEIDVKTEGGKEVANVYKIDPSYAPKVLAHEIGHLVDWLPDKDLSRGNILGRIASLKKHLKHTLESEELGELRRDNIMNELKGLTQKWKPFDTESNTNYTRYRHSSAELYADAVSVLINDPDLLQETAPQFYEAFHEYMDKKPEFKATYEDVKVRMHNREVLNENRAEKIYEGYQKGLDKRLDMMQNNQTAPEGVIDFLAKKFADQNHDILKVFKDQLRAEGYKGDIARRARNMLEELPYMSSEIEDYYYHVGRDILDAASTADIDINDLSLYLQEKRILTDRTDIANPLGHTEEIANEQLQALEKKLGEAKYATLEKIAEDFYTLRAERVISRIEESGQFDPELVDHIKDNKEYVTFSVINYLDGKFGDGAGSGIYKQYGTLSEIENPLVATMIKDANLLSSINIGEAKQAAIIALKEFDPENITEAPTKLDKNIMKYVPEKAKDKNKKLLTFMVDGEVTGYHVPREIAEIFEHDPYTANVVTHALGNITQFFKNLWVSRNPAWAIANMPRDFMNSVKNNPEIKIRDIPKLARKYGEAFKEAWGEVKKGERSEDISFMRRNRMLTTGRMYQPRDTGADDEILNSITSILNRVDPREIEESNQAVEAMKKVWEFLGDIGKTSELAGQLGGFKYLRDNIDLATDDLGHRIRTRVGTPDFKRRGQWHSATNNIFMFSNIRKESWRAAAEAFADNPASYLWKTAILTIIPKLMQLALEHAKYFLPDSERAQEMSEIMEGISDYRKRNYLNIPLFIDREGKSHAITLPNDFTGQFFNSLLYDITKGNIGQATSTAFEQSPYNPSSLNPLIKLGFDMYQYGSGRNVYDFWRGENAISDEAMALGGTEKFKEFMNYQWGQLGGTGFVHPNYHYADGTAEHLLNVFPFSTLGRFYHITDAGHWEDVNKIYELREEAGAHVNRYDTQMKEKGESSYSYDVIDRAYQDQQMYNRVASILSGGRSEIQRIENNDRLSDEEKKEDIRKIEREMINIARQALGKEPLGE